MRARGLCLCFEIKVKADPKDTLWSFLWGDKNVLGISGDDYTTLWSYYKTTELYTLKE